MKSPITLHSLLSKEAIQEMLLERCKSAALELAVGLLEEEVQARCGPAFSRKESDQCHRGGSELTSVVINGGKYRTRRPRLRNGKEEVSLEMLERLRSQDLLDQQMQARMLRGVSTRNYEDVVESYSEKLGVSKSSVSRAFFRTSQKDLETINTGDLKEYSFVALTIDGLEIEERTVVVAMGITSEMTKVPLGLREGDTENAVVVKDLLASLVDRGFQFHCQKLLVVLDGAKALRKALRDVFGEDKILVQRCWLHKLRNLKRYVPETLHGPLHGRMKKLMNLTRYDEAKKELQSMTTWLGESSHEAQASMEEVGEELLTVHQLGLPKSLRDSLSTTNCIESLMSVVRRHTHRVTNWKTSQKQIGRWVASAIVAHQSKMRRLRGYKHAAMLIAALGGLEKKQMIA